MGRKLTPREIKSRHIECAVKRIKTIEKDYGKETTRLACQRYATRENEAAKLEREIKCREEELQRLKKSA